MRALVAWIPAACSALYLLMVAGASTGTDRNIGSVLRHRADTLSAGRIVVLGAVFVVAVVVVRLAQDRLTAWLDRDLGQGRIASWLRTRNARRRSWLRSRLEHLLRDELHPDLPAVPRRYRDLVRIQHLLNQYPRIEEVRATMLGNVETAATERIALAYGMDLHAIWPRLWPLLSEHIRAVVAERQRRSELMLASTTAATFTAVVAIALFTGLTPWFTLLAVVAPAVVSRLTYTSAVRATADYGEARRVAIDLYRFDLLTALHLPLPANESEERHLYRRLVAFWAQNLPTDISYVHTTEARQVSDEVHQAVQAALIPPDPVNFRGTISAALDPRRTYRDLSTLDETARTWRVPVSVRLPLVIDITTGEGAESGSEDGSRFVERGRRATLPLEVRGGRMAEVVELDLDIDGPYLEIDNPDTHMMCPVDRAAISYETTVTVPRAGRHDLRISVYSSNRLVQVLAFELVAGDEEVR